MVVTVRLMHIDSKKLDQHYGKAVSSSIPMSNRDETDTTSSWIIEISGLAIGSRIHTKFFQQLDKGSCWGFVSPMPPLESFNGLSYIATEGTDGSLVSDSDFMPLPTAVEYLNVLEQCGLKLIDTQSSFSGKSSDLNRVSKSFTWTFVQSD